MALHLPLYEPPAEQAPQEEPGTREQRRSRRKRRVRAKSIRVERLPKQEMEVNRLMYPPLTREERALKPKTRGDCVAGPRPCPWVTCRWHLYTDVSPRTGSIKLNFPDLEVEDMTESCALDVADRGGTTLEDAGAIMNLTRERIRQLEVKALERVLHLLPPGLVEEIRQEVGEGPIRPPRVPYDPNRDDEPDTEPPVDEEDTEPLEGWPVLHDPDFDCRTPSDSPCR